MVGTDSQTLRTAEDWDLVVELLQRERRELPVEIHHADAYEVKDHLRRRLDHVGQLLERMAEAGHVAQKVT